MGQETSTESVTKEIPQTTILSEKEKAQSKAETQELKQIRENVDYFYQRSEDIVESFNSQLFLDPIYLAYVKQLAQDINKIDEGIVSLKEGTVTQEIGEIQERAREFSKLYVDVIHHVQQQMSDADLNFKRLQNEVDEKIFELKSLQEENKSLKNRRDELTQRILALDE